MAICLHLRFCAFLSKLMQLNHAVCGAINKKNIFLFLLVLLQLIGLKIHMGRVEVPVPFHQCGLGWILAQTQYVRLVCWFSTLLQEVIPWVLQVSPLTKNQQRKQKTCCATVLHEIHRDFTYYCYQNYKFLCQLFTITTISSSHKSTLFRTQATISFEACLIGFFYHSSQI